MGRGNALLRHFQSILTPQSIDPRVTGTPAFLAQVPGHSTLTPARTPPRHCVNACNTLRIRRWPYSDGLARRSAFHRATACVDVAEATSATSFRAHSTLPDSNEIDANLRQ
jgi:hypothetical protein